MHKRKSKEASMQFRNHSSMACHKPVVISGISSEKYFPTHFSQALKLSRHLSSSSLANENEVPLPAIVERAAIDMVSLFHMGVGGLPEPPLPAVLDHHPEVLMVPSQASPVVPHALS